MHIHIKDLLSTLPVSKLKELVRRHNAIYNIKLGQAKTDLIDALSKLYKGYTNTYLIPYDGENLRIDKIKVNITKKKPVEKPKIEVEKPKKEIIEQVENIDLTNEDLMEIEDARDSVKQNDIKAYVKSLLLDIKPKKMISIEQFRNRFYKDSDIDRRIRDIYTSWRDDNFYFPSGDDWYNKVDDELFNYKIEQLKNEITTTEYEIKSYTPSRRGAQTKEAYAIERNKYITKIRNSIDVAMKNRRKLTKEEFEKKNNEFIKDCKKRFAVRKAFLTKAFNVYSSNDKDYIKYMNNLAEKRYPLNYDLYALLFPIKFEYNDGMPIWIIEDYVQQQI